MVINQIKISAKGGLTSGGEKTPSDKKIKKTIPKKIKTKALAKEPKKNIAIKVGEAVLSEISQAKEPLVAKVTTAIQLSIKHKIASSLKWTLAAIVFIFLLITVNIYFGDIKSIANRKIANFIPYPGVIVNHKIVLLKDFQNDLVAVEKNLKRQNIPYTERDAKNSALKGLIQREVIFNLAKQQNLTVSNEEINQQLDPFIESQGGLSKTNELINDLYGWDVNILKEKIIKVVLLNEKLAVNLKNIDNNLSEALFPNYLDQEIKKANVISLIK